MYRAHKAEIKEHLASGGSLEHSPPMPPLMAAYRASSPEDYMARMIEAVKASELEQTLLVFPLDVVVRLLEIMETLLSSNCTASETICRMFIFVVEVHFGPLSSSPELHPLLARVRKLAGARLTSLKDTIGFNIAALEFAQNRRDERQAALELEEAVTKVRDKRGKRKKKQKALQTAILSL